MHAGRWLMSVVVIIELTAPGSSGWQNKREAVYGPFPTADDARVRKLRRMAEANHGAASVTVLPLRPMPTRWDGPSSGVCAHGVLMTDGCLKCGRVVHRRGTRVTGSKPGDVR